MTFNSCSHCGTIKETATIKLNRLKKIIEERSYILKYGDPEDKMAHAVRESDLWDWSQELQKALEEI